MYIYESGIEVPYDFKFVLCVCYVFFHVDERKSLTKVVCFLLAYSSYTDIVICEDHNFFKIINRTLNWYPNVSLLI